MMGANKLLKRIVDIVKKLKPIYKSDKMNKILKYKENIINEINNRKENRLLKL